MPGGGLAWAAEAVNGRPTSLTWTAALVAWVAAVPMFKAGQYVSTIPHEGGHALLAKLLFVKLKSIRFRSDAGGGTAPAQDVPWLVDVLVSFVGYVGASLFGLLAAWLLVHGHVDTVLWGSLVFLAMMLLAVRGWLGWMLVPGLFVAIFLVAVRVDDPALRALAAHVWTWFLLIAPVQDLFWVVKDQIYLDAQSDPGRLRRLTKVSGEFWTVLLLLGALAALLYGGALLLRQDPPF